MAYFDLSKLNLVVSWYPESVRILCLQW